MPQNTINIEEKVEPAAIGASLLSAEAVTPVMPSVNTTPTDTNRLAGVVAKDGNRRMRMIVAVPVAAAALVLVLPRIIGQDAWLKLNSDRWLFVYLAIAVAITAVKALRPTKKARMALIKLAEVREVEAVGSLVDSIRFHNGTTEADSAVEALIQLLSHVTREDRHLLTPQQIQLLQSKLIEPPKIAGDLFENPARKLDRYARLQIAILELFEKIGDGSVLNAVRIATKSGPTEAVRRAAMECLPFVEMRAEKAMQSKTLLRASGGEEASAASLLRPASSSAEIAPEEMLRPAGDCKSKQDAGTL